MSPSTRKLPRSVACSLTCGSKIAQHMADSLPPGKGILIDAFAGAGGNAIAFARSGRWKRVYAIEKDANVLACAKRNAAIYGVKGKISWFHGDCFEIIQKELADVGEFAVIFASPPWGGVYGESHQSSRAERWQDPGTDRTRYLTFR